jgi:GNAT superfamily N-acetyltransferase
MTHRYPPSRDRVFAAIDATWPPHRIWRDGDWTFRQGLGGGKRVSATTLAGSADEADIALAEKVMAGLGQPNLFMIRPQDTALDQRLAVSGYDILDPVVVLLAAMDGLPDTALSSDATILENPSPAMAGVWRAGGIGGGRLNVMRRCKLPKACIGLADRGGMRAVAFVAIDEGIAMCHAVEVLAAHRLRGFGGVIMAAVVAWARTNGADRLGILTTRENTAALALYSGMGMVEASGYHYRFKPG